MVGGGILALAGVGFAASGPSAILAFLLNGLIALVTALSFAEMAAANPQSGGTYTYAKKALTVNVAFGVGWVVWFASLVAAVLYALGFGAFTLFAVEQLLPEEHVLFSLPALATLFGLAALLFYIFRLTRSTGGGGMLPNVIKLVVFAVLIAGGLAVVVQRPVTEVTGALQPFFSDGFSGLLAAMGYTFIALQGFDLIASAAGEIKKPERTIPKAMIATLAVGLAIYLPLLFVVMTVGMSPGENISDASAANPETIVAIAARNYLGAFGFWLVIVGGIFSMLSALQANLFAASRIAFAMARDRTLHYKLSQINKKYSTPYNAVILTGIIVALLILVLPDVAAAGAASSLIFLITFALAQIINMLMRKRSFEGSKTFRVPWFPYLPIAGTLACVGLAGFQAVAEPSAGIISALWLVAGMALFIAFFIKRAKVIDASEEALDPDLVRLRGLSPLVLLPISNPANAQSMVFVANSLAPPLVGRVLLLSIVIPAKDQSDIDKKLENNRLAMQYALNASLTSGLRPDALTTIADEPWQEIARVVKVHNCRSMLLGLSSFSEANTNDNLEKLVDTVNCDVVVFRQPFSGWKITEARKILIPVTGFSSHDALRARVAASLWRATQPDIMFVNILGKDATTKEIQTNRKNLARFAGRIIPGETETRVIVADDIKAKLIELTRKSDLVIMGLGKSGPGRRAFGDIPVSMAQETNTALIFISHK